MFSTVLIPVDLTEDSSWRKALPIAVDQARKCGGQLLVMTVVDLNLDITAVRLPESFGQEYRKQMETRPANLVRNEIGSDLPVRYIIRDGRVYREILAVAEETNADLIVMASHRPGFRDYLLVVNSARVVRHASCSVMVVRGE